MSDNLDLHFHPELTHYYEVVAELAASRELCRQFREVAEEYHKQLDELTHVIGLTPIKGNFQALQESFNVARKLIVEDKLSALNQSVNKTDADI